MRKAAGIILLILIVGFIIYAIFFYEERVVQISERPVIISSSYPENYNKISIKYIDSLSASLNLDFTIKNALNYPVLIDLKRQNQ